MLAEGVVAAGVATESCTGPRSFLMASGTWEEVDFIPPSTAEAVLETNVEPFRMILTALISRRFKSLSDTGKTRDVELALLG